MKATFQAYVSEESLKSLFADSIQPVSSDKGIRILPLDLNLSHAAKGQGEHQSVINEDAKTAKEAAQLFESSEALSYVAHCFRSVRGQLDQVLERRTSDRSWIDSSMAASSVPSNMGTVSGPLGKEEAAHKGHVPFGPLVGQERGFRSGEGRKRVAPLPNHLKGPHVTLFGPADGVKMCQNAMGAVDRKLQGEGETVASVVEEGIKQGVVPMWGADDEDSRTPLRSGMLASLGNLLRCMKGSLPQMTAEGRRSTPIRRIPGLALPAHWMTVDGELVPLHLLDFCLHMFHTWPVGEKALTFYMPKMETEEEAAYLGALIRVAEDALPSQYRRGSVRVLVVLENPRAVFRVNEIMDALYPYFAGASLGWHDYLAASARLFRNDPTYRIPAKADPQIVVKHIRESHLLLSNVVKARGGVAIGGMYGVLPVQTATGQSVQSDSMQACIRGMIRDVVLQLRRGLDGLWVAHPDFVRIGLALVLAFQKGLPTLKKVIFELVTDPAVAQSLYALAEVKGEDQGLDPQSPLYARSLLAAELAGAGATIQNHDEEEVRYNTFQAIQYLTDWLLGNGCVALPAEIAHPSGRPGLGVVVRVMDDLATTERSRWEVALEIYHKRLRLEDAVRIAREEMLFFRTGGKFGGSSGGGSRLAAIPWHDLWSPIAYRIWLLLITTTDRVIEFVTELLLPFTIAKYRNAPNVWEAVVATDPARYAFSKRVAMLDALYGACLSSKAAEAALAHGGLPSSFRFSPEDLRRATAAGKFLGVLDTVRISPELPEKDGCENSRTRLFSQRILSVIPSVQKIPGRWVLAAQRSRAEGSGCFFGSGNGQIDPHLDRVQIASLSKPIGSAYAMEYFARHKIPLNTSAAAMLRRLGSSFVLESAPGCPPEWAEEVTLEHLMCHCSGIGQHYVHSFAPPGVPQLTTIMQGLTTDLGGQYKKFLVERKPDTHFAYSGGSFIVLQHILESLEGKSINEQVAPFLQQLGMQSSARLQDDFSGPLVPGVMDDGKLVQRRAFPGIAAGCVCSAEDTLNFLRHLVAAFDPANAARGSGPISHDTAVRMLGAPRRQISAQARDFIACDVGCGLFIGECGDNRVAIHQGANEGYRGLFVACYSGPAAGAIIVTLAASDAGIVPTVSAVARDALFQLGVLKQAQVDLLAKQTFNAEGIPQETIVNQGMKSLLFQAFVKTPLAPPPRPSQDPHPLTKFDKACCARIVYVSNDTFAQASNLIDQAEPAFDPRAFGPMGKVMDSWESVRHNPLPSDDIILELKQASDLRFAEVSTKWHDGNQCPAVSIHGRASDKDAWIELLPISELIAHGMHRFVLKAAPHPVRFIRVGMYPDGGLTRVRLYGPDLPKEVVSTFPFAGRFPDAIPAVEKANALFADHSALTVTAGAAWRLLTQAASSTNLKDEVNVIAGAKVTEVSNQHYGPASSIVSLGAPRGMFDGFETKRARAPNALEATAAALRGENPLAGKCEHAVVQLLAPFNLVRLEVVFTFFVNNNPARMTIEGSKDGKIWHSILADETVVKPYRGNVMSIAIPASMPAVQFIRVKSFPCGGFNRLWAYATVGEVRKVIAETPSAKL